jgi:Zn finger protein HypA/HybF involved in hydrogenase expression
MEYCAEHGEVEPIEDNGIERCPTCQHATSTTLDEAVRFASQDEEQEPTIQGVCRDCGNGTLNNNLSPAFETDGNEWRCNKCWSTHLDIL